jgi:hypothetical protein
VAGGLPTDPFVRQSAHLLACLFANSVRFRLIRSRAVIFFPHPHSQALVHELTDPAEDEMKEHLRAEFEAILQSKWPECQLKIFGSSKRYILQVQCGRQAARRFVPPFLVYWNHVRISCKLSLGTQGQ